MIALRDFRPVRDGATDFATINLTVDQGEILVLMGASGVGKTTLLDALRGELAHTGQANLPANVHSVYQGDNQLFPWKTIRQNFDMAKVDPDWLVLADRWNLSHLIDRRPTSISGGQRQRFVLLRSIFRGADLLLCDEPLNHLDSFTAHNIAEDFRDLVKTKAMAVLWVTHNIAEAAVLADKCVMLTPQRQITVEPADIRYDHVRKYLAH